MLMVNSRAHFTLNKFNFFYLVAHKAFPKAQWVKDLVIEMGTPPPRYNGPPSTPFDVYNWNSYNDNRLLTNVKNFLKGNFVGGI
jgi:hypothetical protein